MGKGRCAIVTLGCKVNQFESEAIAEAMAGEGWEVVPFGPGIDCTIVNTCVVTGRAEADSRRWIHRARRANPHGLVLAVGCFPQIDPPGVISLGVDGVAGNQEKARISEIVEELQKGDGPVTRPVIKIGDVMGAEAPPALQVTRFRRHTRAFLKIQDGCDARCSYCIVPLARGRSRSIPPQQVLASLKGLQEAGYEEVVLAGIHLGAYGLDLEPRTTLLGLLHRIEAGETPSRIRLSSLEPQEVTPELVAFISASQKICPHLHLPLQSGADVVLGRMKRPYTREFFRDLVLDIADHMPHAAIGVDVMVGFPGEDERAFQETYDLLKALPLSYLHCFPFSPRPGTPAGEMPLQVEERVKKERAQILRNLGGEKKRTFYSRFINQPLNLLIEHRREKGMLRGISKNYIFCLVEGSDELMGREVEGVLIDVQGERGIGRLQEVKSSRGPANYLQNKIL
jgi:threonylcarbamoyladenosine tRNA methylthiotransferase MtaB